MLSFFSKKKQSPDTPTEDIIQGPQGAQEQSNGDDFIFVEKREPAAPAPDGMYPPMPPAPFGLPYPGAHPAAFGGRPPHMGEAVSAASIDSTTSIPYIQGVPFELAPQISSKNDFEVVQMQVDGILALLTRQISVDETSDYNFTLERSIQGQVD